MSSNAPRSDLEILEFIPSQKPESHAYSWWTIIPFGLNVAMQFAFGWEEAKRRSDSPDMAVGYVVGAVIGGTLLSALFSWFAFRLCGRSRLAANVMFSAFLVISSLVPVMKAQQRRDAERRVSTPVIPPLKAPAKPIVDGDQIQSPDHPVVMTIPEGWGPAEDVTAPGVMAAVDPQTGDSVILLTIDVSKLKNEFDRTQVEAALLKSLGTDVSVLHREECQFLERSAYCWIFRATLHDQPVTLARIMIDKRIGGYSYAAQFAKFSPEALDADSVPGIIALFQMKK